MNKNDLIDSLSGYYRLGLRSGDGRRLDLHVAIGDFHYGGEPYSVTPELVPVRLDVSRTTGLGWARPIRTETGVGKDDSEGPKSAERMRCQYIKYCSISGPPVPYSSCSAARIMATASGQAPRHNRRHGRLQPVSALGRR
jgi:hypothetical protein